MKILKFQFVIFFFLSISLYGQTPSGFNYQAVAREANGNPISNKEIRVRFTVLQGSEDKLYVEYQKIKTSDLGTFSAVIGTGNVKLGDFNEIKWDQDDLFIQVDMDPNGGYNYIEMGTQQLNAVPYAMYALNGKKGDRGEKGDKGEKGDRGDKGLKGDPGPTYIAGKGISIQGKEIIAADPSPENELQKLTLIGSKLSISDGNTVILPSGSGSGASKIDDLEDGKSNNKGNSIFLGKDAGKNDDQLEGNNTGLGSNVLTSNSSGTHNVALGNIALFSNTKGSFNTATGSGALAANKEGDNNTAVGANSLLFSNGDNNTAVGTKALHINTSGHENTAIGAESLSTNTTGYGNSSFGKSSLKGNTNGKFNTAIGLSALSYNKTGSGNTAIGYGARGDIEKGDNNTAIGKFSFLTGGSNDNFSNSTALGYETPISGSNQIHLGNTQITEIKGQVKFTTYSDGRIKDNINEDVKGLEFITKLRPVTYHINNKKQKELMGIKDREETSYREKYDIEKIKFSGFIAQEVEKAANETGYDFSGVKIPKNEHDLYGLSYSEFVVPLVKAVQELEVENQQLIKDNLSLKQNLYDIIKRLEKLEK